MSALAPVLLPMAEKVVGQVADQVTGLAAEAGKQLLGAATNTVGNPMNQQPPLKF